MGAGGVGKAGGREESSGEASVELSGLDAAAAQRLNPVQQLEGELLLQAEMEKEVEDPRGHRGTHSGSHSDLVAAGTGRKPLQ